ncbi:uncharacterized protein LOC134254718 [Saccostrea cucullata]|uniref:uncharacterized protein LOC134254718 n=1 Tax=Saccostrea cuccullata TaxID=36930 RepID=UPI002ED15111
MGSGACPPSPIVSPLQANNLTSVTTETYTEVLCNDQWFRTGVIVCGTLNIILTGVVIILTIHIIRTRKRMRSSYENMDFKNSESAATTGVPNFAYSTLNSEQPRPQSVQHNIEQSSVSEYVEMT